jgi:hypothetical protein
MVLQFVRALWGGLLLLAPQTLLDRGARPSTGVTRVTRMLGARHVLEALILSQRHRATPPRWAVIVDGVHGASMVAVAICSPRLRRDALASAAVAGLLGGWTEIERRRA